MHLVFLLPPIQGAPTGGNRYNEEVIRRLGPARCRPVVWPDPGDVASWPAEATVLVDSLLVHDPAALADIRSAAGRRPIALLAHYLAGCDPTIAAPPSVPGPFDRYLVPSAFMRDALIQRGVEAGRISVARPGVSSPSLARVPRERSAMPRLLTVASQLPVKGLLEAVQALSSLSDRDWQWDLVGDETLDPEYSRVLVHTIAASPIAGRVRSVGPLPPAAMGERYAGTDLLLVPSRFESFGMAVREGMAHGLPVVAFDVGGLPESIVHGHTGWLVPAGDDAGFAEAVRLLLDDAALRRRLGDAAQEVSRTFPGWGETVRAIERALAR
jgi:glycosyltransferase involved in cell wall biosynthesis